MDEEIDLIVKAIAEGFQQAGGDIQALGGATEATGQQAQTSGLGFTELHSAIGLVGQAAGALQGVYNSVVQPALNLSDSVRRLNADIGATPEEASKLVYAAGQMGVATDTLTTALDAAIKKGHAPTIANLAAMSDAYLALAPGIERTKYLEDEFGKSGAQLGAFMQLGSAGILAMGQQAQTAGVVLNTQGVDSLHHYEQSVDELGQHLLGLKVQAAETFARLTQGPLDEINKLNEIGALAKQAKAAGIDLSQIAGVDLDPAGRAHVHDQAAAYDDLKTKIDEFVRATDEMDAPSRLAANGLTSIGDASAKTSGMLDEVSLHAQRFAQQANLDADAAKAQAAAQAALNEVFRAGTQVTLANSKSIDDLLATNAKLERGQGVLIPQTKNYNELILESAVAHDQLTQAQQRVDAAQQALDKNHDPKKWFELGAAVDAAQLALMRANDAYGASVDATDKAGAHVANYTTAIDKNTKAIKDNLLADFGQSIVNQLGKVDVGSAAYNHLYDELQRVNPEMAKQYELSSAQTAAQNLLNQAVADGKITGEDAAAAFAIFSAQVAAGHDPMVGLAQISGEIATKSMPALKHSLDEATLSAIGTRDSIESIKDHSATVTITTNHVDNYTTNRQSGDYGGYDAGGSLAGGKHASGVDFVVPPGFSNDTFPLGYAQSGERVTITPAGQPGNGAPGSPTSDAAGTTTINYIINDRLAAALAFEQTRRRNLASLETAMS